jgi:hypothetical protein
MSLESTSVRIWKRLSPGDKLAAANALWAQPPHELQGAALGVIVKARHLRPQAARALKPEEQARILASILDPGEAVSSALLVALHMADRRPLLVAFLDAVGLPHDEGVLKEEADALPPPAEAKAREGVLALKASFPLDQVLTYMNVLWLQDPERWQVLEKSPEWLAA